MAEISNICLASVLIVPYRSGFFQTLKYHGQFSTANHKITDLLSSNLALYYSAFHNVRYIQIRYIFVCIDVHPQLR
jgi:hypothetical protein